MQSILTVAFNATLPVVGVIGLAALLGWRIPFDTRLLSHLVINLFAPCLVVNSLAHSQLSWGELGAVSAMVGLSTLILVLLGWVLARLFHFDAALASTFELSIVLGNTGSINVSLTESVFGQAGLQYALLFWALSLVVINTVGIFLASHGTVSAAQSALNILRVPLMYATFAGLWLGLADTSLPTPIERLTAMLGQATVPCSLVLLGLQLSRLTLNARIAPIVWASVCRLLIAPIVGFGLAAALGITGLARQVSILQTGVPTATLTAVLAAEFGGDAEFASAVVLVTTLVGLVTQTVLLATLVSF